MAIQPWSILTSRIAFESPWHTIRQDRVRLPDGLEVNDYFVSVKPDIAMVFPVTVTNEVVLVRQYKHGVGKIVIELPAGTFANETPEHAARRELLEETGCACGTLRPLGQAHQDVTRNTNAIHMFLATGCEQEQRPDLKDLELSAGIDLLTVPLSRVLSMVRSGEITALCSVATILRALDALAP